ncbi:hypothetical protein HMPREF9582_00385 [Cutibacterium acnes HL060PA1]|nr:hypothetical protein HMPREF9582_00385 [Cutibacterium acnes HL060PA1]
MSSPGADRLLPRSLGSRYPRPFVTYPESLNPEHNLGAGSL